MIQSIPDRAMICTVWMLGMVAIAPKVGRLPPLLAQAIEGGMGRGGQIQNSVRLVQRRCLDRFACWLFTREGRFATIADILPHPACAVDEMNLEDPVTLLACPAHGPIGPRRDIGLDLITTRWEPGEEIAPCRLAER